MNLCSKKDTMNLNQNHRGDNTVGNMLGKADDTNLSR